MRPASMARAISSTTSGGNRPWWTIHCGGRSPFHPRRGGENAPGLDADVRIEGA